MFSRFNIFKSQEEIAKEKAVDEFNKLYQENDNVLLSEETKGKFKPRYKRSLKDFKEKNYLPENFLYPEEEVLEGRRSISILKAISLEDLKMLSKITLDGYIGRNEKDKKDIKDKFYLLSLDVIKDLNYDTPTPSMDKVHLEACLELLNHADEKGMSSKNSSLLQDILKKQLELYSEYEKLVKAAQGNEQELIKATEVKRKKLEEEKEKKSKVEEEGGGGHTLPTIEEEEGEEQKGEEQEGGKKKTKKRKPSKKNIKKNKTKKKTKRKNLMKRKTHKK